MSRCRKGTGTLRGTCSVAELTVGDCTRTKGDTKFHDITLEDHVVQHCRSDGWECEPGSSNQKLAQHKIIMWACHARTSCLYRAAVKNAFCSEKDANNKP